MVRICLRLIWYGCAFLRLTARVMILGDSAVFVTDRDCFSFFSDE